MKGVNITTNEGLYLTVANIGSSDITASRPGIDSPILDFLEDKRYNHCQVWKRLTVSEAVKYSGQCFAVKYSIPNLCERRVIVFFGWSDSEIFWTSKFEDLEYFLQAIESEK